MLLHDFQNSLPHCLLMSGFYALHSSFLHEIVHFSVNLLLGRKSLSCSYLVATWIKAFIRTSIKLASAFCASNALKHKICIAVGQHQVKLVTLLRWAEIYICKG